MKTTLSLAFLVAVVGCGSGSSTKVDLGTSDDAGGPVDMAIVRDLSGDMAKLQVNCDPTANNFQGDCSDPMKKCTEIALDPQMTMLDPECQPITGMKMIGDSCMRTNEMVGVDDCAKGGFCSSNGSLLFPPPMGMMPNRHCRAFCSADADCKTAGEKCLGLDPTNGIGLCVPTCTPFGTDCMQGYECSNIIGDNDGKNFFDTCRFIGTSPVGGTCKSLIDCAANEFCVVPQGMTSGTCFALCDKSHACPMNMGDGGAPTCQPLTMGGLLNGIGVCQ